MSTSIMISSAASPISFDTVERNLSTSSISSENADAPNLLFKNTPRIIIPTTAVLAAERESAESPTHSCDDDDDALSVPVITPKGSSRGDGSKEKVGRWSDEEHKVFLEGLDKHGKQWKVIAGMIGTRTVVQVRTHAQKYFQKMERHNTTGPVKPMGTSAKRKMSLPASLPSRINKKPKGSPTKKLLARSASLSVAPASSPTHELSAYPSYISNSSMSDSCWSTFSPTGVVDTFDAFSLQAVSKETTDENNMYDFKELGQDPLEWLVDVEPSILPESSLPVFPDLSSTGVDDGHHYHHSEGNFIPEDPTCLEPSSFVNDSILNSIVDPNVTVQSLFLLPDHVDE